MRASQIAATNNKLLVSLEITLLESRTLSLLITTMANPLIPADQLRQIIADTLSHEKSIRESGKFTKRTVAATHVAVRSSFFILRTVYE